MPKISALSEATDAATTDLIPVLVGGTTKSIQAGSLVVAPAQFDATRSKYSALVTADDWRPALVAADTDASVVGAPVVLPARLDPYAVSDTTDIAIYQPAPGAVIQPANGKIIRLPLLVSPPPAQIFDESLGGKCRPQGVMHFLPEWWGPRTNTAVIQKAIDACYDAGGGFVLLTYADAANPYLFEQIVFRSGVKIIGVGMECTFMKQVDGTNIDPVVFVDVNVEKIGMADLTVDCNKAGNTVGGGIVLNNTGAVFASGYNDPYHSFKNMRVLNSPGSNWQLIHIRESDFYNCSSMRAGTLHSGATGVDVQGASDNHITNFIISSSDGHNMVLNGPNNTVTGLESFYAGQGMLSSSDPGDALSVWGARNRIGGAKLQDAGRHGLVLFGSLATGNIISWLQVDSCGRLGLGTPQGVRFDNAAKNLVHASINNPHGTQPFALGFFNGAVNNTVVAMIQDQSNGYVTGDNAGGRYTSGNDVTINGNGKGAVAVTGVSGSYTPDPMLARIHDLTLSGSVNFAAPVSANRVFGTHLKLIVRQDATGGRAMTFQSGYNITGIPSTEPNAINIIECMWDGAFWTEIGAILPPTSPKAFRSPLSHASANLLGISDTAYWVYMGLTLVPVTIKQVAVWVTTAGSGSQTAEVAVASTPVAPNRGAQTVTVLGIAAPGSLTSGGVNRSAALNTVIPAGTHLWAGLHAVMGTTQPTYDALAYDYDEGYVLSTLTSGALIVGGTYTGAKISNSATGQAPALRLEV